MSVGSLRFYAHDTLIIGGSTGQRQMFTVVKRRREGYLLRSNDGADDRTWRHDEIYRHYVDGNLEHFSCNLQGLDKNLAEVLQADWEAWPPSLRFQAECRLAYCEYVDRLRIKGLTASKSYQRAARTIFRKNKAVWTVRSNQLLAIAMAEKKSSRRKGRPAEATPPLTELKEPSQYTVRNWHRRWKLSGRDIRALIPQYHARGDRTPRREDKRHLQADDYSPLCIYGAMRFIALTVYLKIPRVPKIFAYSELLKYCLEKGIPKVSHTTFYRYLNSEFSEFEEFRDRYGAKAAFYKFNLFARRQAPERPLEEVQVDHTLLDVFVMDANGKVGRPWLTLIICRGTRCVVGLHIGFDVPSYATVQRAVVHAICPKDLSGIDEIENEWPCHGVMDALITDRGLEFMSESLRSAGQQLGFAVVNLPGRCPYLKGEVERFFGSLNVRVLSYLEGTTISRTDEVYDPQAKAKFTLSELTHKIVKWIVDSYHIEKHPTIGCSPLARWQSQTDKFGVRPMRSFRQVITLVGETVRRTIQNTGIQWEGHTYRSAELTELRKRRGGLTKGWTIRCDPYDRGEIWVLDEEKRRWLSVPAVHQQTARGVTKYQARIHLRTARKMAEPGAPITDEMMVHAKELCDQQAYDGNGRRVMRYLADGALATPVAGVDIPVILSATVPASSPQVQDTSSSACEDSRSEAPSLQNAVCSDEEMAWEDLLQARLAIEP